MLLCCACVSLFALLYPVYVIRPFRQQGPRELLLALAITRYRPFIEICCAILAAVTAVLVWRNTQRRFLRGTVVALVAAVVAFAVLSRVNIYEQMFHPLQRPLFQAGSQTKLDSDEEVIAVSLNGSSRAYPIRSMSYHHIVNDVLGTVPIVATY